jgi:NAD-specific glutamate dehydrogenase
MVDLYNEQRRLSAQAMQAGGLAAWMEREDAAMRRLDPLLAELKSAEADIARLMVALRHIRAVGAL